jgi:hypothetical protein
MTTYDDLAQRYTEDARYIDPLAVAEGRDRRVRPHSDRAGVPRQGARNGVSVQACQDDHFFTSTVTTGPSSAMRWY